MPLQDAPIDILFGGGIDAKTAKHIVASNKVTRADNRFVKGGLLARRYGCKRVYGPPDSDAASIRLGRDAMLATFRGNLVARDRTRLWPWSDAAGGFLPNGIVDTNGSPVAPPAYSVEESRVSAGVLPDFASSNGVDVVTWVQTPGGGVRNFYFTARDSSGAIILAPLQQGQKLGAPPLLFRDTLPLRVTKAGTGFILVWSSGTTLNARYLPDPTNPSFGAQVAVETGTDYYYGIDVCPLSSGEVAVVALRSNSTGTITRTVKAFTLAGNPADATLSVTHSATVATYSTSNIVSSGGVFFEMVAIAQGGDGNIFVAYSNKNGSGHASIRGAVYTSGLSSVTAAAEILDITTAWSGTTLQILFLSLASVSGRNDVLLSASWIDGATGAALNPVTFVGLLSSALAWAKQQSVKAIGCGEPFALADGSQFVIANTIAGGDYVLVASASGSVVARIPGKGSLTSSMTDGDSVRFANYNGGVISIITLTADTATGDVRLVPYEHHGSLYFPGSMPRAFDGQTFHEVGFTSYLDDFTVTEAVGSGSLAAGTYLTALVAEWIDASGELHQSFPILKPVTLSGTGGITWTVKTQPITDKLNITYRMYRSEIYGGVGSATLYRLDTVSLAPGYLSATEDETGINSHVILYTIGGIAGSFPAPPCKHIGEHGRRLVLSGCPDGNVYFSPPYVPGIAPRFTPDFFVSPTGQVGGVVATASMDGRMYLVCERGVEYVAGDGPDETGTGSFSPPLVLTVETGTSRPQSVKVTPSGLAFQGAGGIFMIGRDGSAGYLGDPVAPLTDSVVAVVQVPSMEEVSFLQAGDGRALSYNATYQQWTSSSFRPTASATLWRGGVTWADQGNPTTSIFVQTKDEPTDDGEAITSVVETAWLRMGNLAGFERIKRLYLLATYRGASTITIEAGFNEQPEYLIGARFFTGDLNLVNGDPIPIRWKPRIMKCRSVRFRITCDGGGDAPTLGCDLTGLTLLLGVKQGLFKMPRANSLG